MSERYAPTFMMDAGEGGKGSCSSLQAGPVASAGRSYWAVSRAHLDVATQLPSISARESPESVERHLPPVARDQHRVRHVAFAAYQSDFAIVPCGSERDVVHRLFKHAVPAGVHQVSPNLQATPIPARDNEYQQPPDGVLDLVRSPDRHRLDGRDRRALLVGQPLRECERLGTVADEFKSVGL